MVSDLPSENSKGPDIALLMFKSYYVTDLHSTPRNPQFDEDDPEKPREGQLTAFEYMTLNCERLRRVGFKLGPENIPFQNVDVFGVTSAACENSLTSILGIEEHNVGLLIFNSPHIGTCGGTTSGPKSISNVDFKSCVFEAMGWLAPCGSTIMIYNSSYRIEMYRPSPTIDSRILISGECDAGSYKPLASSKGGQYNVRESDTRLFVSMLVRPEHLHHLVFNVNGHINIMSFILNALSSERRATVSLGAYVGNFEICLLDSYLLRRVSI